MRLGRISMGGGGSLHPAVQAPFVAVACVLLLLLLLATTPAVLAGSRTSEKLAKDQEQSLAPLASGLLKFDPVVLESAAQSPESKFPLVLAERRTRRPDVLDGFKLYRGGWNITNNHYWASVGFTGVGAFLVAFLWCTSSALAFTLCRWYKWGINIRDKSLHRRIFLVLLLVFTCTAMIGGILLSVGQADFRHGVLDTLGFVVNQSDFTVQILRNVTEYLSLAKNINVDQIILPSEVQRGIDKLNVDLNDTASTLSDKMSENSHRMKHIINKVYVALVFIAPVMLLVALAGSLISFFRRENSVYIFIVAGWVLVAVCFILCGNFVILKSSISDTCTAVDEWVDNPHAETALSSILPCVDESTSNVTLHQSKNVTRQLVNVVNTAIRTIANSNSPHNSYYYNQTGLPMPPLCSPYDSHLNDRQCKPWEVPFSNASLVWQNYICKVSASGLCMNTGRVTPDIYDQLVAAVNASYALDHYSPLLLSLRDCNFVRDTFNTITGHYCPRLESNLKAVNAGLAMLSTGVMLCLILWVLHANRPRREEVFVTLSDVKIAKDSDGPTIAGSKSLQQE